MKTLLVLFLFLTCTIVALMGQDTIPNGNFEQWSSTLYLLPDNYPVSSNQDALQKCKTPNVVQTSEAYHGKYAVQLTTLQATNATTDTVGGWLANSTATGKGDPTTWPGGIPFNQIPTGITGYFQYNVDSADSALVGVVFKKNGASYAHYFYALGGIHASYTRFSFNFSPALSQAPDSVIVVMTSSNLLKNNGIPGSAAKFDSIAFTGSTQPALLNGDFEAWSGQSTTPELSGWFIQNDAGNILQTQDAESGKYALELKTIAGKNPDKSFFLYPGYIQDGVWNSVSNTFSGGFPYPHNSGILTFWYKYAPANPNDSAIINIMLKKSSVGIGGNGMRLKATSAYTYIEMPFYTNGTVADSAMIGIGSSYWRGNAWADTAVSYVGADLKIDQLAFKALSTGLQVLPEDNNITFYPNPMSASGTLYIPYSIKSSPLILKIFSLTGETIRIIPVISAETVVNRSGLSPGMLFYEVLKDNIPVKTGKIIVR